ncbi:MAG: hypothetical protein KatS3mg031_2556 [Chitinophagales bacterium]|nr:MAG: hypothetical protein KatS3mg031_2556 [Chitinophagales bacterium]
MRNLTANILQLSITLSLLGSQPMAINAWSQPGKFELVSSLPMKGALLSSDKLQNAYVITERHDIVKISPVGKILFSNNIKSLGPVGSISTSNPLKILVYYPEFATIVLLDNTLSQTSRVNLMELGAPLVSAACLALDNNIWIYDQTSYKLKKIDDKLKVLAESDDLNALTGIPVKGVFLLEADNQIFLSDPEYGVLVFDSYGTYSGTIPLKGLHKFQKINDQLVYCTGQSLYSYNLFTFTTLSYALPDSSVRDAVIEKNRLFVLTPEYLNVYSH